MNHNVLIIGENPDKQMAPFEIYEANGTEGIAIKIDFTDTFIGTIRRHVAETLKCLDPNECYDYRCIYTNALKYALDSYGFETITDENTINDKHKFGYVVIDDKDFVIQCIKITNPKGEWDFYDINGGGWNDFFLLKNGSNSNFAVKKDIDFDVMRNNAGKKAEKKWDDYRTIAPNGWDSYSTIFRNLNNHIFSGQIYNSQESVKKLRYAGINFNQFDDNIGEINRCEYVEYKKLLACVPHSMLYNGVFYRQIYDYDYNVVKKFWDIINNLDDTTLLTIIDYHR